MWIACGLAVMWAEPTLAAADGVWTGTYLCAQGETPLELYVSTPPGSVPMALFHFGDGSPALPEGCFSMTGSASAQALVFTAHAWLLQPPGYVTVNLLGSVQQDHYTGLVAGPGCTSFDLAWHPVAPPPPACRVPGAATS